MKRDRSPFRFVAVVLLWAIPVVSLSVAQSIHALQDDADERTVPNISIYLNDKLKEIYKHLEADEYVESEKELQRLLSQSPRYNGHEIAQIHRAMAAMRLGQESYEESIYHFEQVLAQVPNISVGMELATMYTVSQLYFQIGKPAKSLEIHESVDGDDRGTTSVRTLLDGEHSVPSGRLRRRSRYRRDGGIPVSG